MADLSSSALLNIGIYLCIPFLFAYLFKRNKISPVVGYMLGGIVVGNFLPSVVSKEIVQGFAYFGILLLLFTIGLEIQYDRMISLKRYIVWGGALQLGLSAISIALLGTVFGFSLIQSLLIGIALSSSSTTIVAKILQDKGEEGSFHGELAMGILMFQDLAFIPFMVIFNSMTGSHMGFVDIVAKMIVDVILAGSILFVSYWVAKRVVPYAFNKVARVSRELLNLFIIICIFIVAAVSTLFHISPFISIFVAGIVVSQTVEHFHIFSQVRPFRDLLAIIFFIYIGTNINLGVLFPSIPQLLIFATVVMATKALIIFAIFLSFRFHSKLSTYLALFLFQIDEDAFILMFVAYKNGVFTQDQYMFVSAMVLLSLIVTPFLISNKEKVYAYFWRFLSRVAPFIHQFVTKRIDSDRSSIDALEIKNHIVVCGYGRIGSYIGRALLLADIPFVAIDYNFRMVERGKQQGVNIIYGDPTDVDMLDYAELEHAVALVLALPDTASQETIIENAKRLNKNIIIISRVHKSKDHKKMRHLGVDVVIQPEFEASISIIKKILLLKRVQRDDILRHLSYFKKEHEGL